MKERQKEKWTWKSWWEVVRDTGKKFIEDNPFRHSAAIAYFTIFSMPGIAIISVMIAGSFYEYETVREELLNQINLLMGETSAEQVESLMKDAQVSADTFFIRALGIVTIAISATTVFASLQDSINYIWKIKPKPKKEILKLVLNRLLSLAMVASIGFLILVSLMVDTMLSILKDFISGILSDFSFYLILGINTLISFAVVVFVFGLIYKVLPDASLKWKNVWVGAIVTGILFVGGKYLIGFYLGKGSVGEAYGAASSLVILLSWVYFSVLILLFGAQFTFIYNKRKGHKIRPGKHAVAIKIEEVEESRKPVTEVE